MTKHVLRILGLFFLLLPVSLGAQEMSVKDFFLAQTDLTANTRGTMVYDQNGEVCALIKLETSLDGFTFDVGSLGVTEVKRVGGELWIYVPFGIRRITISHPQLGVIRDFRFPIAIEKARTYIMKLNASLGARVYDNSKKQTFKVHIEPREATFEINGMSMPLDANGNLQQEMSFGTYDISVTHPDYHSVTTEFTINDPDKPQELEIKLKQNYGWIAIPSWDGETLWIDDVEKPITYGDTLKMRSGHYRLRLKRPNYKAYETSVEVKDSLLVTVDPGTYELWAKRITVNVPDNVGIYLDTIKIGEGMFNGFIEYGNYLLSARKRGCRPTQKNITVDPRSMDNYTLEAPLPAYGTLNVTVDPSPAEVYVDEEYVGAAPGIFRLAVDDHKVSVRKKGKDTEFFDVFIKEEEELKLDVRLVSMLTVKIVTEKPGARIWIDDKDMGVTPLDTRVEAGVHRVKVVQEGFKNVDTNINFDNPRTYTITSKPKYTKKAGFYINADAAFPSFAAGGGLGIMIKKFNLEVNGLYGLSASEPVYWNSNNASTEPSVFTYKPIIGGARMGLEIPLTRSISVIPRAGANLVIAQGTPQGQVAYDASLCSSIAAVVDVRATLRLAKVLFVTITPEFDIAVSRSALYTELAKSCSAVAGWDSGFRIKAGLCLLF